VSPPLGDPQGDAAPEATEVVQVFWNELAEAKQSEDLVLARDHGLGERDERRK